MTKEKVIAAILRCTEKLGRVPTLPELMEQENIDRPRIRRFFGNYRVALETCGLEVPERGRKLQLECLFKDWARVARKLKKLPTIFEYEQNSHYSEKPLSSRFGGWSRVPEALKLYALKHGLASEWQDVMELIEGQGGRGGGGATISAMLLAANQESRSSRSIFGAVYGPVLGRCAHVYAPTNEGGVVCLFGAMAEQLGFMVLRIQAEFPDCEAIRLIGPERYLPVRIEFEYESRNFLKHMHDRAGCDLIVCWEHNWEDCPLEVVELKAEVQNLTAEARRRGERQEFTAD